MKYFAEVIVVDRGRGPVECIRCKCEYGTLIGYFATVKELASLVDLASVVIKESAAH